MRLLDLFSGRWGWSRAFAARGWQCVGIDLTEPPEIPANCTFIKANILQLRYSREIGFYVIDGPILGFFDAVCASSPCEQFAKFGMRMFHPNPPYPELGIQLFNHARALCEEWGGQYIMENVRAARDFVGPAAHHCGPFYLWGSSVPPLMPQGIIKGMTREALGYRELKGSPDWNRKHVSSLVKFGSKSKQRKEATALNATIPPELSNCVCDYIERILESQLTLPAQSA